MNATLNAAELLKGTTPGPFRQGETLLTEGTRNWSTQEWQKNELIERRRVFTHFRNEDEGHSRRLVAVCEHERDTQLFAAAPALAARVVELEGRLRDLVNCVPTEQDFCRLLHLCSLDDNSALQLRVQKLGFATEQASAALAAKDTPA